MIGRSVVGKRRSSANNIEEKLISLAPYVDIHYIPDSDAAIAKGKEKRCLKSRIAKLLKGLAISRSCCCCPHYFGCLFSRSGLPTLLNHGIYLGVLLIAFSPKAKSVGLYLLQAFWSSISYLQSEVYIRGLRKRLSGDIYYHACGFSYHRRTTEKLKNATAGN